MTNMQKPDFFDDFRPYNHEETVEAINRIKKSDTFYQALQYFFSDKSFEELKEFMETVNSTKDFQMKIMYEIVDILLKRTSNGLSFSGFEKLDKNKQYVFLSNHRDIFIDSGILLYLLVKHGFNTTEITFGNNLMQNQLIVDVGKVNKMFKVYRKGKPRELMEKTAQLSEYIRYTILHKKESIWIAQRGGRTKDGNDLTQSGIIKMFNTSGKKTFEENLKELNIVPVSISYEFEPCDAMKLQEQYLSKSGTYEKKQGEDIKSIANGVTKQKGRIHLAIGDVLDLEFNETAKFSRPNEKIAKLTELIDTQIHTNYKTNPINYIAYDRLLNTQKFTDKYSSKDIEIFENYMLLQLSKISGNKNELTKMFLKMYAYPVINKIKN